MADKKPPQDERTDPTLRYRYIGFEVFAKEKKPFFASDEEQQKYVARREEKKQEAGREFSLLFVTSFGRVERVVLFAAALVLVASPALPWFFLPLARGSEMFLGFQLAAALAAQAGALFGTSLVAGLGSVLALIELVLAPVGGVLLLLALFGKSSDPANPYRKAKRLMNLQMIPIVGYLVLFGLGFAGFKAPESPLPIFREGFNIFGLISNAGWGFWAVFVAHLLPAVKSADL